MSLVLDGGSSSIVKWLAHLGRSWQAFRDDPEWKQVSEGSQKDGPIVSHVEWVFLDTTDNSPLNLSRAVRGSVSLARRRRVTQGVSDCPLRDALAGRDRFLTRLVYRAHEDAIVADVEKHLAVEPVRERRRDLGLHLGLDQPAERPSAQGGVMAAGREP